MTTGILSELDGFVHLFFQKLLHYSLYQGTKKLPIGRQGLPELLYDRIRPGYAEGQKPLRGIVIYAYYSPRVEAMPQTWTEIQYAVGVSRTDSVQHPRNITSDTTAVVSDAMSDANQGPFFLRLSHELSSLALPLGNNESK